MLPEVLDPDSFAVGLAVGLLLGAFVAIAAMATEIRRKR